MCLNSSLLIHPPWPAEIQKLKLKDKNLCSVQFSLPDRWKPYNKIKDRNLCSVQFSLPDRWKPYNKIKDRNLCLVQFLLSDRWKPYHKIKDRWKPYNKIKDKNLCSIQFSLLDKWEPYHETKGKGSSSNKLNTIIFLIISTTSSQVLELVLMKFGDDSFSLLSVASIQEIIIVKENKIRKSYYFFIK